MSATPEKSNDAIAILTADHDKAKRMFREFERLHEAGSAGEAANVARQICRELTIHASIEEEIFYPEVRAAIDDADLIDEAEVEHASARELIARIETMAPGDAKFAAHVCVLGEYVDHHIKEEQEELFPKARKAGLDLQELGAQIEARKQYLSVALGVHGWGETAEDRQNRVRGGNHALRAGDASRARTGGRHRKH